MKSALLVLVGVGVGAGVAGLLIKPSDCCVRVAAGVRTEVGSKLGSGAVAVGDAVGLWKYTPGLLSFLGVKP